MEEENALVRFHEKLGDSSIANQEKWFNFFKILPRLVLYVTWALVFIWSIADVAAFSRESYYYGESYGLLRLSSPILALLIWWVIGIVFGFIQYVALKLSLSYKVLHLSYLKAIMESCVEEDGESE